jgi:carbon storage regulator CsrA
MGLVISRKVEQSFFIGNDTEVKVIGVDGRYVKLLITAPGHVQVTRPDALRQAPRNHNPSVPTRPSEDDMISRGQPDVIEQLVARIRHLERTIQTMRLCQCDLAKRESPESTS